jgi:hypothetical protein
MIVIFVNNRIISSNFSPQVDADGATDIRDLANLYRELQRVEIIVDGASIGVALGSRYLIDQK